MFSESISYSEEEGTLYLGSCLPLGGENSCSVPLPPLCFWCGCMFICPFLDEFWDLLVLGYTEQLQSSLLMGSKATHLPYELGVFGEVPPAATVPGLPLLKSTAIG